MDALTALLATAKRFLAAGGPSVDSTHLALVKVVRKPWGEERWLVAEGSPFGFKVITVRAGRRTSLQYHRQKEEAHLVLSGEGRLRLAGVPGTPLTDHALVPGQVAHIRPGTVHRVEAVTDLVLVEVSTPELDDVVRIEDDRGRGDGRIEAEHRGP